MKKLTERQARFCREYIKDPTSIEGAALRAGYSAKYARHWCHTCLMNVPAVKAELRRLTRKAESKAVLTAQERMEILSAIGMGNLVDYITERGLNVGPQAPNPRAIKGLKVKEFTDKAGNVTVTHELTLRDPVGAIHTLNRMTGDYAPEEHTVHQGAAADLSDADLVAIAQGDS